MSPPNPVASRRTTMAAGLAGLAALSGCDLDPRAERPGSDETTAPPVDADAALVELVRTRIEEALGMVLNVRQERRDLRQGLRGLVELHGRHLRALGPESERALASTIEVGTADLGLVRRAETRLQRQLTDAAVRAESGALAKLLASMAAAVAQQLAVLA